MLRKIVNETTIQSCSMWGASAPFGKLRSVAKQLTTSRSADDWPQRQVKVKCFNKKSKGVFVSDASA